MRRHVAAARALLSDALAFAASGDWEAAALACRAAALACYVARWCCLVAAGVGAWRR